MGEGTMKLMEEMNRFEAEIASDGQPSTAIFDQPKNNRPIIGANTYQSVQQKLENSPQQRFGTMGSIAIQHTPSAPLVPLKLPVPPPPPPPSVASGFPGVFPTIPPPPPPPSFLIPHQVRTARPAVPMLGMPGSPPSESMEFLPLAKPGPVIVSAAPTKYKAPSKKSRIDEEINDFLNEIKKEEALTSSSKSEKSSAKIMADKVKTNTVVSIQPVSADSSHYGDHSQAHGGKGKKEKKNKKLVRMAGGQVWEDNTLLEWEDDDFRIFCGDLGNDVTDEVLIRAFNKYPSFLKAKVVRDKRTNKTKGFGFVSFKDPQDFIKAMKEMNGRYVGSRPIKLRKSCWRQRSLDVVKKKEKEKTQLISLLTGR